VLTLIALEELLKPASTSTHFNKAYLAQPLCTAVQIALVNVLSRRGIQSSAVVGHSSGEISAAYAAGALSCHDALVAAYYRGYVCSEQTLVGAWLPWASV
jgi:malonyl CoA-acyl carrier protein transacylase